ncbi:UMP kinase [Lyticum sinuosum]|uniref:Uridylate kinase n=1 Tax=Lyticum sinuosum TaxID=1332059 RepID=A0AAE5AGX2_9RICK|nr:UMP kinase [Lyticum sinuosum]MDZ5761312.1 Uridylate kinase [Lyticum sinuosum]
MSYKNIETIKYSRILLKLSGEALMQSGEKSCIDPDFIDQICQEIKDIYENGCQIAVVVGGGNICRGATMSKIGIDRANADYMGMLATIINAIAIQGKLENYGVATRVQSAISMPPVAEPYIRRRAIRHMEKGRVVIFSGGTGNPFFTTDSAAILRAIETNCDIVLKGTQVDGVYSADPKIYSNALHYNNISYEKIIQNGLHFMDTAAVALAQENEMPIIVFNVHKQGSLKNALMHQGNMTFIGNL